MSAEYITKTDERLDQIVEKRYGDTDNRIVEFVLDRNPNLPKNTILLPRGITVFLPDRPVDKKNEIPVIGQIRLWD